MTSDLDTRLNETFDTYRRALAAGGIYPAIKILGEINNCLGKLDNSQKRKWLERLWAARPSEDSLDAIVSEVESDVRELDRLVSIGEVWQTEDIILLLTYRIQIDLVIKLLTDLGLLKEALDLSDIDFALNRISEMGLNRRAFRSSVRLINKNWGLPITNTWLGS